MTDHTDELKTLQRHWQAMISISHDFFHKWRQVVLEKYGQEEADRLSLRFWELVGRETGDSYINSGKDRENIESIVKSIVRVSLIMGEKARYEKVGDDYLLIHDNCPWIQSYQDTGVPGQCQAGCDHWFMTSANLINPNIKVVTESCLVSGDSTCTRRYSK